LEVFSDLGVTKHQSHTGITSANNAAVAAPELTDLTVDHIVCREAAEAEGTVFAHVCELGPPRDRVEARRKPILARGEPQLVETRNPGFVRT